MRFALLLKYLEHKAYYFNFFANIRLFSSNIKDKSSYAYRAQSICKELEKDCRLVSCCGETHKALAKIFNHFSLLYIGTLPVTVSSAALRHLHIFSKLQEVEATCFLLDSFSYGAKNEWSVFWITLAGRRTKHTNQMVDIKTGRWKHTRVGKNCRWSIASSNLSLSAVGHYHLKADDNSSPKYSTADSKAAHLNLAEQKIVTP